MNTYEWLLDYINVLSFAIGVENLRKNNEQINSLEEHLSKQDAQYNGTLFDQRDFVLWYLDSNYERVTFLPKTVGELAREYPDNIMLCTMKGHICCIKYGTIYDTFDPSERFVEYAWFVE